MGDRGRLLPGRQGSWWAAREGCERRLRKEGAAADAPHVLHCHMALNQTARPPRAAPPSPVQIFVDGEFIG